MTTYAIIQLVGKQFKVAVGETIVVDRLNYEEGKEFDISDVLMIDNGKTQLVGTPLVDKKTVTLKVLSHGKGEKLRVATYKAKARYRKTKGHRQYQTTVEVVRISA